jgi:hypothetical protein
VVAGHRPQRGQRRRRDNEAVEADLGRVRGALAPADRELAAHLEVAAMPAGAR